MEGNTVTTSSFGSIVPRISGFTSALCSMCLMFIILRSSTGISKTYHRIMFCMSACDIIGSTAIALTTLPMPTNDTWVNEYNFTGVRLGNTATCTTQGFASCFGMYTAYSYQMSLCAFYACGIGLEISQENITKYIEPFLHLLPLGISLYFAVADVMSGMFNPAPKTASWCTATTLPYNCELSESAPPCVRGTRESFEKMTKSMGHLTALILGVIILSLTLVCGKVTLMYVREKRTERNSNSVEVTEYDIDLNHRYRYARAVAIQASAYVSALICTVTPALIELIARKDSSTLSKLHLFFFPLQGLFNFLIFVGAKVDYLRNKDSDTVCITLRKLFKEYDDTEERVFLSGISMMDIQQQSDTDNAIEDGDALKIEDPSSCESDKQSNHVIPASQSVWNDVSWSSRQSVNTQSLNSGGVSDYDNKNLHPKKIKELDSCAEERVLDKWIDDSTI